MEAVSAVGATGVARSNCVLPLKPPALLELSAQTVLLELHVPPVPQELSAPPVWSTESVGVKWTIGREAAGDHCQEQGMGVVVNDGYGCQGCGDPGIRALLVEGIHIGQGATTDNGEATGEHP